MAVLAPLGGPWAVFIIATLDAGIFGIPVDPLVAYYVHTDPHRFLLFSTVAALGSAAGSMIPYIIGYKGGEALIVKRIGQERFSHIHSLSEKYGELALIVPAMLPPPTPMKLFVFSAGVAEMSWIRFVCSMFVGRFLRFLILSALTIEFGPQIVDITEQLVKRHLTATLLVLGAIVLLIVAYNLWRKQRSKSTQQSSAK